MIVLTRYDDSRAMSKARGAKTSSGKMVRRPNLDAKRLAVAATLRIKSALMRGGLRESSLVGATREEIAKRESLFGAALPESYRAALDEMTTIGEPDELLDAKSIARTRAEMTKVGRGATRYFPFARRGDLVWCFELGAREPEIVEWRPTEVRVVAKHFGAWLDAVADQREEALERAARMPERLRALLIELGFRFEDPLVGRLETGDVAAIESLIGRNQARAVRADVDRLFDSSGKASVTLNVDDFSLAVALRTGIFLVDSEEVFRWLRTFRDENFFEGQVIGRKAPKRSPGSADKARDLRTAKREAPLVLRGTMAMPCRPAQKHTFRAASGRSASDFYLLGRTRSTKAHSTSLILHVVDGVVATAHALDEALVDLYVSPAGQMWGLSSTAALLFGGAAARTFPLERPTSGRSWWQGIGGSEDKVLVWGAGALLEHRRNAFVPFEPSPEFEPTEAVLSLYASGKNIWMLVSGNHIGAVARFDGKRWAKIEDDHLMEGNLLDLDMWRGIGIVVEQGGGAFRIERGMPTHFEWDLHHEAFRTEAGARRRIHGVKTFDGGALAASDGGVLSLHGEAPIFHAAEGSMDAARLARVGAPPRATLKPDVLRKEDDSEVGIVAMCAGHVWLWRRGAFEVVDLREW